MNSTAQGKPVSLADEEAVKQVLVNTIFGLWEIVNNLIRLRPSKRERYRVTTLVRLEPNRGHSFTVK